MADKTTTTTTTSPPEGAGIGVGGTAVKPTGPENLRVPLTSTKGRFTVKQVSRNPSICILCV